MRIVIATLLMTALALPLAGAAGPVVSPAQVTIRVGEEIKLHGYQNAGGFSQGFPYHYVFFSDAPEIATVDGFASGSSTTHPDPIPHNGDIFVKALQAGTVHVRIKSYAPDLATITVLPQIGPVHIHAEATRVLRGQDVVLLAVLPGDAEAPLFLWYRGRLGDKTQPLQASTEPRLTFVATNSAPTYVWVQAFAGSITSSAEIAIETVVPRSRSVRH